SPPPPPSAFYTLSLHDALPISSSATRNLSTASGSFHRRSITWSTVARWKGCRDCITCSAVTCSVLRSSIAHLRDVRLPDDVPQLIQAVGEQRLSRVTAGGIYLSQIPDQLSDLGEFIRIAPDRPHERFEQGDVHVVPAARGGIPAAAPTLEGTE